MNMMAEATQIVADDDPALQAPFVQEMLRQMRAVDTYGIYDDWSLAKIVDPLVLTKERKRAIPVVGDPDEITISRIKAFYNALSATIESRSGLMAVPLVNLSHEGFGRALIMTGKLVVVDRTLRDVHRFGFQSLEQMCTDAEKLVDRAVATIDEFPAAAGR